MKGIKREFSIVRTPQQNGVVERKNRTLIKAARTMLVDSKLSTTFWAKAVNTAYYVQNRVLVIKPHNKTPYELFNGRPPIISFMRPFGCLVTILNTLDHLGKFDRKADEGFFVRYSVNSKAFRLFNSRTRIVEETLHITFLENKPNVAGSGSEWLFDIDTLTKSMNYKPVFAGNETNGNAGTKESNDTPDSPIYSSPKRSDDEVADDAGKKTTKDPTNEGEEAKININSTNSISVVSSPINTAGTKDADDEPMMPNLEDTSIFGDAYDDEDFVAGGDINNLESSMSVSPIETTRVHKDHPVEQIIRDLHLAPQTRRMTKNSEEHGLMNVKSAFLYGKIEEELYVCQPPGFEEFIRSTKKELCTEFEKLMHKKFQMSYMGKLTFFLGLQVTQKDDG
ncbi:putative ribonuclease H-like domain-containing protein [Tanacetum coccineum]